MKRIYNSVKRICIALNEKQVEYLQQMSHKLSLERNENLTLSDLIREALDQVYPIEEAKKSDK